MKDKIAIPVELVRKAQNGDSQAIEDLLIKSEGIIKAAALPFSLGPETEDILQEVRLKIFEKLPRLKNPAAYFKWAHAITQNLCIDFLKKKRPYLLEPNSTVDGDSDSNNMSDLRTLEKDSYDEFKKAEDGLKHKERIERVRRVLNQNDIDLLKRHYVYGYTLEELASQGNYKKSSYAGQIEVAVARWIVEEANQDWEESNFEEARGKLAVIVSDFKPDDASKEKRYLLGTALRRLAAIHQVQGDTIRAVKYNLQSKEIWRSLHDDMMLLYVYHTIACINYMNENYIIALKMLHNVKDRYPGNRPDRKLFLGNLERDLGDVYIKLGEAELAKLHIERSLNLLEEEHRSRYFSALRKRGQLETMLKKYDKAFETLQESVRTSPPYKALHHVQTKIALVNLFCHINKDKALQYAEEARNKAVEYGFAHQLLRLKKVLRQHGAAALN